MTRTATAESTQTRLVWTFFWVVAIGQTAFILAATVSSLAGGELASTRWSGLPSAFGTAGLAAGAMVFTWVAARFGRTASFTAGYLTAASGAAIAGYSITQRSFPLLLLGMVILGLGQSTSHLARYAAADLRPSKRRATTIGMLVWAGTIGAVLGPRALNPAGKLAVSLGFEDLVGPYLSGAVLFGTGALVFATLLRPDPAKLAIDDEIDSLIRTDEPVRDRPALLGTVQTRLALVSMGLGQGVMVLVMTQTPLHLRRIGEGLDVIGNVMTAHTLGMFAIAPLTGYLVKRLGTRAIISLGSAVLIGACALSFVGAAPARTVLLLPGLLLLGIGWNFTFVAGSTHLMNDLTFQERTSIQGIGDTLTWIVGGSASIASGFVVSGTSYSSLSLIGALLALVPIAALVLWREHV
ncbi:MAG: MFS transporter, partial [Acidimicrobiia bacterium]|nr:MFS transporter [Acidimicrobiia bacterium]